MTVGSREGDGEGIQSPSRGCQVPVLSSGRRLEAVADGTDGDDVSRVAAILPELAPQSALPLPQVAVESVFFVQSSGFPLTHLTPRMEVAPWKIPARLGLFPLDLFFQVLNVLIHLI